MNNREYYFAESDEMGTAPVEPTPTTELINDTAIPVTEIPTVSETVSETPAQPSSEPLETPAVIETSTAEPVAVVESQPVAAETTQENAVPDAATEVAAQDGAEAKAAEKPQVVITPEILERLKHICASNEIISLLVDEKVKGGLRLRYEEVRVFLPTSQFSVRRDITDAELQQQVGKHIDVHISEIQTDDVGKVSIIASRRKISRDEAMKNISVGAVIDGTVTQVMPFGMFVDIGGINGMVHISRVSNAHIVDLSKTHKKGDKVKVTVVEVNTDKDRVALSMKEHEPNPWSDVESLFPAGSNQKGIVRRLSDFGAFIELQPGIEGLLRISEVSWTKRTASMDEVMKEGDTVEVYVINTLPEKRQISLSLRRLGGVNPWIAIAEKFPVGAETTGVVKNITGQGVVITIEGDVDGFMPRSKLRGVMKGSNRIPYFPGDLVSIIIAELNPEKQSLIFQPKESGEEETPFGSQRSDSRRSGGSDRAPRGGERHERVNIPKESDAQSNASVSLGDLLSESEKKNLFGG